MHHGGVLAAAFSPDGARVVTATIDGTARIANAVALVASICDRPRAVAMV